MKIKSLVLFSLKLYSVLSFRYRSERLKSKFKINAGDLVKIKSENSLVLRCPKTGETQSKKIKSGDVCVFIGIIHRIEMDNFPRAIVLHDGILSFIANHRSIENTLIKII